MIGTQNMAAVIREKKEGIENNAEDVLIQKDEIVKLAQPGDYFEIMKYDYPLRSRETFSNISNDRKELQKQINILRSIPQPEQRTKEWYTFRHELMTASNLWKLFGTESQYNSLIYEKCSPVKNTEDDQVI